MPFVCEEVWHWWHEDSVHRSSWPTMHEFGTSATHVPTDTYASACVVLESIRRAKSTAKVSQRAEVATCTVSGPDGFLAAVRSGEDDVRAAGAVREFAYVSAAAVDVAVTLAEG